MREQGFTVKAEKTGERFTFGWEDWDPCETAVKPRGDARRAKAAARSIVKGELDARLAHHDSISNPMRNIEPTDSRARDSAPPHHAI